MKMKVIPKNELIILLKHCGNKMFVMEDMKKLFEGYGDEWYICDGTLELTKKNLSREKFLKEVSDDD